MTDVNFLEELLDQAEKKELAQTEAYYDLLLSEILKMQNQIEQNFTEAEKEIEIINKFILKKNSVLDDKIKFLEKKLEAFIKERGEKTIELANGILKMHKKPDRVEVSDLELFLKNARKDMLSVVPEQLKPDLNKIKALVKGHTIPAGVTVIPGEIEFSYKIKKEEKDGRQKEIRNIGAEYTSDDEALVRRSA